MTTGLPPIPKKLIPKIAKQFETPQGRRTLARNLVFKGNTPNCTPDGKDCHTCNLVEAGNEACARRRKAMKHKGDCWGPVGSLVAVQEVSDTQMGVRQ